MTKELLESITLLFALSANKKSEYDANIYAKVYKDFLNLRIEARYHNEFLSLFINKLSSLSSSSSSKSISLNSVRLIRICEEVKTNLSIKDRFEIIFYLVLLIISIDRDKQSFNFVLLVAELFEIDPELLKLLYNNDLEDNNLFKHNLYYDNIKILGLYHSNYDFIIIKALSDNLKLDGKVLIMNEICLFKKDSVLAYKDNKKYYFPEIESIVLAKQENDLKSFDLYFSNIEVKNNNKILLHKSSLNFKSGEIIGVLGNSGSGKTTMLKALYNTICGKYDDERKLISSKKDLSCGFLEHHTSYVPGFTLKELLQRRADVLQIDKEIKNEIINNLLISFKLTEHKDKIVLSTNSSHSQLSSGQIKRLALASEMMSEPDILILDEPTSGLSSLDAMRIVSLLKKIALDNKIIISSIHQPDFDLFMMFDKVIIIDDYGYPIFYDSPLKTVDYFRKITDKVDNISLLENNYNPSIIFNIIGEKFYDNKGKELNKRKVEPQKWYKLFLDNYSLEKSSSWTSKSVKISKHKVKYFKLLFSQLKFLCKIELINRSRFLSLMLVPIICGVLFSCLLRFSQTEDYHYFYNSNIPICCVVLLTSAIFLGIVDSGHEFILYRKFYDCESRLVNKFTVNLLFARCLKYLLVSFMQTLLLVLPAVYIIHAEFNFLHLLYLIWALLFWGNIMGIVLSILVKNISVVYIIACLILIPQILFSGVMINFSKFNTKLQSDDKIPYFADFMPLRWATEAMIVDFYSNNPYEKKLKTHKAKLASVNYYLNIWLPFCYDKYDELPNFITNELKKELNKYNLQYDENSSIDEMFLIFTDNLIRARNSQTSQLDSIYSDELFSKKLLYSNNEINNIICNYSSASQIGIYDDNIVRKHMLIYISPDDFYTNRFFLSGIKRINGFFINTYYYNLLFIIFYSFVLILIAVAILRYRSSKY